MKESQLLKSKRKTIVDILIKSIIASYSQINNFIILIEYD